MNQLIPLHLNDVMSAVVDWLSHWFCLLSTLNRSVLTLFFFCGVSYEVMHSCWSPVPKCRPSFQHLVSQLEALSLSLSPAPLLKEHLLYVNLEGDEGQPARGGGLWAPRPEEATAAGAPSWSVPWQHRAEDEEKDWLMVGSGAALAIGGDYRYIIGPCGASEEEEGRAGRRGESMDPLQEEVGEEEDDVVINV